MYLLRVISSVALQKYKEIPDSNVDLSLTFSGLDIFSTFRRSFKVRKLGIVLSYHMVSTRPL